MHFKGSRTVFGCPFQGHGYVCGKNTGLFTFTYMIYRIPLIFNSGILSITIILTGYRGLFNPCQKQSPGKGEKYE